jgi:DNA invertase Pin-like site-specific DNA recombinase
MLAVYCRISGKKGDDKDTSIAVQKEEGAKLALRLGLKPVFFVDEGISGTKQEVTDRPAFASMLKEINSKKYHGVYTLNQDRIERNSLIWQIFVGVMLGNDCKYYPNGELFDLDNPNNRFIATIQSASNALYASLTSQRVKLSIKRRASEGRFRGQLPYGFMYDDKNHIKKNEKEAEIVRMMYDWSMSGIGSYTIANKLNEMKVPTKFNKFEGEIKRIDPYTKEVYYFKKNNVKWRGNVVHDILINPINKGKKKLGDELFDVPYIVSEDEWERAMANLKENKKNVGKKVHYNYLLNGIIYCSHCGRQMVGKKRIASGDNSYKCKGKIYPNNLCEDSRAINIYRLETFLIKHLFESKELEKHLLELPEKENNHTVLLSQFNEEKNKLISIERDYKHQLSLITNPSFSDDENIKKVYMNSRKSLEKQKIVISDLEDKIAFSKNYSPKENVKKVISDYVSTLEFKDVKKLIHSLIEMISIRQVKEEGKMGTFIINIKYRGFEEISTFITNWFAVKWIWISRYRLQSYTHEQIEEDRELAIALLERNNITIDKDYVNMLKQNRMTDEEIDRQNPFSKSFIGLETNFSEHSIIEIKEEDLINFN